MFLSASTGVLDPVVIITIRENKEWRLIAGGIKKKMGFSSINLRGKVSELNWGLKCFLDDFKCFNHVIFYFILLVENRPIADPPPL